MIKNQSYHHIQQQQQVYKLKPIPFYVYNTITSSTLYTSYVSSNNWTSESILLTCTFRSSHCFILSIRLIYFSRAKKFLATNQWLSYNAILIFFLYSFDSFLFSVLIACTWLLCLFTGAIYSLVLFLVKQYMLLLI